MRKSLFTASVLALAVAVAPACATKKFVRTEVGNVNSKVDTVSGTVEKAQERIGQNEARIGTVGSTTVAVLPLGADVRNVLKLPSLVFGSFGYWGLGWLDTSLPVGVPILATFMVGGVVLIGLGAMVLPSVRQHDPDAVVLDLGLPDADGLDVLRTVRAASDVPVIIASARGDETDRIVGLELGADDYVTKPFSLRELGARVRAVLRRATAKEDRPLVAYRGDHLVADFEEIGRAHV